MPHRIGSPLAIVNALALTSATLLTGAWEAGGHGHDTITTNIVHCVVDHEAGGSGAVERTTLSQAAAPHDHSCVACKLGRTKTVEDRKTSIARIDLFLAASGSDYRPGQSTGERRQQTARGPPTS